MSISKDFTGNGNCYYCGTFLAKAQSQKQGQSHIAMPNDWTRDHIVPRSRGGSSTVDSCLRCNHDKGRLTLEEYRLVIMFRRGLISPKSIENSLLFWGEKA
jgi:5-methylcytosine-specific restriction endonuclease McrA